MTNALRPLLWCLLAAALFVRAFVPQGYMPERSADSSIAVGICGSAGHSSIPLREGGSAPQDDQRADPPCAFAGLGAPALPPVPPIAVPEFTAVAVAYSVPSTGLGIADASLHLPPVRGPPLPA